MGLPSNQVMLTPEQIAGLNARLSTMRHDVNNKLALISASAELSLLKPDTARQRIPQLLEQTTKITDLLREFSAEFEKILQITRP
jgi:hypothetical protein